VYSAASTRRCAARVARLPLLAIEL